MIIQSSNVALSSERSYEKKGSSNYTTTRWNAMNPSQSSTSSFSFGFVYSQQETMYNNYNDFAKTLQNSKESEYNNSATTDSVMGIGQKVNEIGPKEITRLTLRSILDMLYKSKGLARSELQSSSQFTSGIVTSNNNFFATQPQSTLWYQVTDTTYSYSEKESTSFAGTGQAVTADGRTLTFDVSFTMSRSFEQTIKNSAFTQYEQVLTDPLIINLDSNPTSISDQTFLFDIDCDGVEDEISSLNSGSGYLALDANGDGKINDGSELFGTKSGNGFDDLASYDEDGNGWIDEADSIYSKLRVWTKDADGNDKLINLKEADVGAICLKQASTQYSYTDKENNLLGMMRNSGIYLKESGGTGTVSQIDFAKH